MAGALNSGRVFIWNKTSATVKLTAVLDKIRNVQPGTSELRCLSENPLHCVFPSLHCCLRTCKMQLEKLMFFFFYSPPSHLFDVRLFPGVIVNKVIIMIVFLLFSYFKESLFHCVLCVSSYVLVHKDIGRMNGH